MGWWWGGGEFLASVCWLVDWLIGLGRPGKHTNYITREGSSGQSASADSIKP